MYNLTIHFGPNAVAWSFLFRDKEKAEKIVDTLTNIEWENAKMFVDDDFGQRAVFAAGAISGVLLEDMEAGQEARILRGMDQVKGQARATKRAESDPEIQALMRRGQQSPGIISPMGANGFGRHQ